MQRHQGLKITEQSLIFRTCRSPLLEQGYENRSSLACGISQSFPAASLARTKEVSSSCPWASQPHRIPANRSPAPVVSLMLGVLQTGMRPEERGPANTEPSAPIVITTVLFLVARFFATSVAFMGERISLPASSEASCLFSKSKEHGSTKGMSPSRIGDGFRAT